jgi:hypothetical protein
VSPWWNEQIRVGIGADRMDFVRLGRGWRPRVIATRSIDYATPEAQTVAQGLMAVFKRGLAELKCDTRTTCAIVLGNKWVRYQLVPWQEGLADAKEHAAYAALQLQSIYGSLAQQWQVTCGEVRYGSPTLVCAIDRELLNGLQRAVSESGLRLVSVKPHLSAAATRWRRSFSARDYWFAMIEGERICLLNSTAGKPRLLRVQQVRGAAGAELAAMLKREAIGIGLGQRAEALPVYVYGPELPRDALAEIRGNKMQVLEAGSFLAAVKSDVRYAMAMA